MICPNCNSKIDYLKQVVSGSKECEVFFNEEKNYIDWRDESFEGDGNVFELYCPECDEELDLSEEEAHELLENQDELKELVEEKISKIKNEKHSKTT